jgi:hypothetical protein
VRVVTSGLIVLAGLLAPAATAAVAPDPPITADGLEQLQGVNFVSGCAFSHRLNDDPILYPGQPGASHDHSFVGNRTTNAFSTYKSLRAGETSCKREGDTAAYWTPTLLVDGMPVRPRGATVYYRRKTLKPVRPFPAGFRAIAGNAHAMTPQPRRVTFWNCGPNAGVPQSSEVPTCPDDRANGLRLHVSFGPCWDGTSLDSPDHSGHLVFPKAGVCPASHPVPVPAITVIFRYPTAGGPGVTLASGGTYSGHADFVNAWHQPTLRGLVANCLNQLRHCAQGD